MPNKPLLSCQALFSTPVIRGLVLRSPKSLPSTCSTGTPRTAGAHSTRNQSNLDGTATSTGGFFCGGTRPPHRHEQPSQTVGSKANCLAGLCSNSCSGGASRSLRIQRTTARPFPRLSLPAATLACCHGPSLDRAQCGTLE